MEVDPMKRCAVCGKSVMYGNQISHSHRLTRRVWKPNLQTATIILDGEKVKTAVCTKCLKTVERA